MDHDGQRWITINDGHDERAEWICGMLVLGEAARQQGHSECIDVEQQHEAHLTARVDGRWPNPLAHLSQRHLSQLALMAGGLTHSRTSRSAVFTPKN